MGYKKYIYRIGIAVALIMLGGIVIAYSMYSTNVKQADSLMSHKKYESAIAYYEKAMKIYNGSTLLQRKLANAKSLLAKQKAIEKQKKAIEEKKKAMENSNQAYKNGIVALNNKDYIKAILNFESVIKEDPNYNDALKKIEECKALYVKDALKAVSEYVSQKKYNEALARLDTALTIDPNNKQLIDLKNKYSKEREKYLQAQAEAKAKAEEAEAKAQEAEAKAREEALTNPYAPKKIVDSNGKQIWKIYINSGSFHFKGTYTGTGNFIVKLLDSNQDLVELIANEIGDYVSDKTVFVPYVGWYYLEIQCTDGSCNYSWN